MVAPDSPQDASRSAARAPAKKPHRNTGGAGMRRPKRLMLRHPPPSPPADGEGEGSHAQECEGGVPWYGDQVGSFSSVLRESSSVTSSLFLVQ